MKQDQRIALRIESELKSRIELLAKKEDRSISNYLRCLILKHIPQELKRSNLKASDVDGRR